MQLDLNGHLVSKDPDDAAIGQALRRMRSPDDVLTLSRPPADFVQATGSSAHGFVLNAYDDAVGTSRVATQRLDAAAATTALSRSRRGDADWARRVVWQGGAAPRSSAWRSLGVGAIALAIFLAAFVTAMTAAHLDGSPGRPRLGDWLRGLDGIVAVAAYIAWLDCFFRVLRPRSARWPSA